MQVLLRAAFHLSALRSKVPPPRIAIVVDSDTGIDVDAITSLLRPWRSWLDITDVLVIDTDPGDEWLAMIASSGVKIVSIVSDRPEFFSSLKDATHRHGLTALDSAYPDDTGRTNALFHEMAHHLYELGGLNEWDGATAQYSSQVLQHISATNCIRYFPWYMKDELYTRHQKLGRPIEALDIGSGSISRLRWGALQGLLHVTGVDPLLDIYDLILTYHGLNNLPSIRVDRVINANAENLDHHIAPGSFDFAFCCNALDHAEDPPAVVGQLARALRPGGTFALEFATREGSRQNWQQLHQFDLFFDDSRNKIVCQWHDGRRTALIPAGAPLVLERVVLATDDYTVAVLRRIAHRPRRRSLRLGKAHRAGLGNPDADDPLPR
jgi:SAM-dependent methyltransferase